MSFSWDSFKNTGTIGVVCNNEVEAKEFCKLADKNDIIWRDGMSYVNFDALRILRSCVDNYEDMFPCVYYSDKTIGTLDEYQQEYGTLFNFADIQNNYTVDLI